MDLHSRHDVEAQPEIVRSNFRLGLERAVNIYAKVPINDARGFGSPEDVATPVSPTDSFQQIFYLRWIGGVSVQSSHPVNAFSANSGRSENDAIRLELGKAMAELHLLNVIQSSPSATMSLTPFVALLPVSFERRLGFLFSLGAIFGAELASFVLSARLATLNRVRRQNRRKRKGKSVEKKKKKKRCQPKKTKAARGRTPATRRARRPVLRSPM